MTASTPTAGTTTPGPRRARPLLIFDGACGFCRLWIERWKRLTGDTVEYAESAAAAPGHPSIPPETFRSSVVLVKPDGSHLTGALAALSALEGTQGGRFLLFLYRRLPGFRAASEALYRTIASHRDEAMLLTRLGWGTSAVKPGFALSGWVFLRAIAVVYAVAFASLSVQILGLVGSRGISPAEMFLEAVHAAMGGTGALYYPTLAWLMPGDGALMGFCVGGILASALLFAGVAPRLAAALCWGLYFSLTVAGQVFLRFQWDALLLEAGFLTIFLAPPGWMNFRPGAWEAPKIFRWLLWLLVFRLMFMSGVVKLSAGDPNWWNLTALSFHYETQCIPTPPAWYAHHLPHGFHKASAFFMFMIEIGAPFLILTPRRLRHLGAFLLIGLQAVLMLTGNFAFFNWLAIALCGALLDDRIVRRLLPAGFRPGSSIPAAGPRGRNGGTFATAFFAAMLVLNLNQVAGMFVPPAWWPSPVSSVTAWARHFHIVNGYGLFRVMTTKRPEIVLEGSADRINWKEYEFRYKPGDVTRALPWVAPHQPRLDWQMWFAALGEYRNNTWLGNLAIRLLEGSPEVTGLLAGNPFPDRPPPFIRAVLYVYRYSTRAERDSTGAVWVRTFNSVYLPPLSLDGR